MLAVLYDVHGNLPALDAVLEDADRAGATAFLLGGDYALFGPWPAETVARLRSLDAEWIRGNGERWAARPEEAPDDEVVQGAIAACRETLGETAVAELGELPETVERDAVLFCHASPSSDVRSFWPEPAEDERELLDGVEAGRVVFGHTHLPFYRHSEGGVALINPGSVGMPFDGDPQAAYALLDGEHLELRRVGYNHEASAAAVRERFGGAFAETVARRIEHARLDV